MKYKLSYMLILLSCLNLTGLNAQYRITGVVTSPNREPIDYVYIFAEKGALLQETFTDADGRFEFVIEDGDWKLSGVSFGKVLFEKTLKVVSDIHLDTLQVSPDLMLDEVIVEASHKMISHREDKLIYNVQKLSKIEGYSANDILKYVPKVISDGSGQLHIGSKEAVVYLNGRRLSPEETTVMLSNLKASDISEIEVQTTHGGEYGADIQGGVIHIKTMRNRTGLSATAQIYAAYPKADYYTLAPNLNLFWGTEKWNLYATYGFDHGKNGSYSEVTNHFLRENSRHESSGTYKSKPNQHTYKIGSLWNIHEDHTLSVELNGIANSPGKSVSQYNILLQENNQLIDRAKDTSYYASNSDFYNGALSYEWRIDTLKSYFKTLLNYNNKQSYSDNQLNTRYDNLSDRDLFEQNISTANAENYSLKSDIRKNWANTLSVRAGIQYLYSKRKSDLKRSSNELSGNTYEAWTYNEGIAGAYIGVSKNIGKVYLYGNLRIEYTHTDGLFGETQTLNKNDMEIIPYITVNHQLTPSLSYNILYTKSLFRPSFSLMNNYSNRISDVLYDVGNPDLNPEKTHIGQLSFNYGNHSTSFEVYHSPNPITEFFEEREGITYHTNLNFGSITTGGVSHSFNSQLFSWWYTNLYAYLGYEYIPKSYNKKELFRGFLSSSNRFSAPAVGDFLLSFNYNSGNIKGHGYNACTYGIDVSYSRSFLKNSLNMQIGIADLLNTRSFRARYYVPTLEYLFYTKPVSRNCWVKLTYTFSSKGKKVNKQQLNNQNTIINRW